MRIAVARVNRDQSVREAAVRALGSWGDPTSKEVLVRLLAKNEDPFTRPQLLRAVAVWGDEATACLLVERIETEELGQWGDIYEFLIKHDLNKRTVMAGVRHAESHHDFLYRTFRPVAGTVEPMLLEALRTEKDPKILAGLCRVLGRLGRPAVLQALRSMANTKVDESLVRETEETLKAITEREF